MKTYMTLSVVGFLVTATARITFAVTPYTTGSSGQEDGCPASSTWISNKQSCYLYIEENANSTQANDSCRGLGAQLVSISSEEENQFILDFVGPMNLPIWIGLFRTTTDICAGNSCGSWEWPDGSKLGYSQWATDIVPNSLQCVFMDSQGEWDHGRLCSGQRGLVCEQKRMFSSTASESTRQTSISDFPDSSSVGEADPTTDLTTTNSDLSSTYTFIVVIVGIVVVVAVLGAVAYFIKIRRGKKREKMHKSGDTSQTRGVSTGSGVYENDSSGAFRRPIEGHHLDRDNSVHLNRFTGKDADTIMYNNAPRDHSTYEAHQAYERVNNYTEIDPEYTHLKSIHSGDTSETIQEDINVVYANVEQK